jgi:hypothetical protein
VVVDVLSRKSHGEAPTIMLTPSQLIQEMERLSLDIVPNEKSVYIATLVIQLLIQNRVKVTQEKDPKIPVAQGNSKLRRGA